jgi:hypothetical protein
MNLETKLVSFENRPAHCDLAGRGWPACFIFANASFANFDGHYGFVSGFQR